MLNDAMFSIVEDITDPDRDMLIVRARMPNHIEKHFADFPVYESTASDYRYRAFVPRLIVMEQIAKVINNIDYSNFKNSVKDHALKDAYLDVWSDMYKLQHEFHGTTPWWQTYRYATPCISSYDQYDHISDPQGYEDDVDEDYQPLNLAPYRII